jgi:hypothetical protein
MGGVFNRWVIWISDDVTNFTVRLSIHRYHKVSALHLEAIGWMIEHILADLEFRHVLKAALLQCDGKAAAKQALDARTLRRRSNQTSIRI